MRKKAPERGNKPFAAGSAVVVYLREPLAKFWGVVRSIDQTGVVVEGVDLRSFDEFVRGAASGEISPHDVTMAFYPLPRVEKILLDRGSESAPSLVDQFRARVGFGLAEFLKPPKR